jgi:two-component system chemotaxis response regulator CheY
MDGIDAVAQIVRNHPEANVIMVSSQGAKERVIEAVKNGAKGYILKPFNKANIKEAIDKLGL